MSSMRLSERAGRFLPLSLIIACALLIAFVRPRLLGGFQSAHRQKDIYLLPSPDVTVAMSLGYRSALADLIFAHVLVAYGQHFYEKRRFEFVADYIETILKLDPKYREPVRVIDTLIVLQPKPARPEDYWRARKILDQGLEAFPNDGEVWLIAGQFMAYLAAPHMPKEERDEWRFAGAQRLARSCELVGSNENIPHHCITAARLFNEAGKGGLASGFLERVLAVSDDPEIQHIATTYLGHVVGDAERERIQERGRALRAAWSDDLTFVSRDAWFLLGPRFDSASCAGTNRARAAACPTSFRAWGELFDQR